MTVLLWILAVLAGLGLLIAWTRVTVLVCRQGETLSAEVRVGPLRFPILPGKEQPKQESNPEKAVPKTGEKRGKPMTAPEIRSLVKTLWPPLKTALSRTRRSIRVCPLTLSVTLGGEEDPAETAQLYGELQAAVWTVMPLLEQLLTIRDPWIHIDLNFETNAVVWKGKLGLSIRIGSALQIVMGLAVPGLKWYLAFRKRHDINSTPAAAAGGET